MKRYTYLTKFLFLLKILSFLIGIGSLGFSVYVIYTVITETRITNGYSPALLIVVPYIVFGISFSLFGLSVFIKRIFKKLSLIVLFIAAGQTTLMIISFIIIFGIKFTLLMSMAELLVIFLPFISSIIPLTYYICQKNKKK